MEIRGLGLIPSPPSEKDYNAELLLGAAGPLPDRFEALLPLRKVVSQGPTSTCVWFAIAQAVHLFLKYRDPSKDIWPSTLFGYYNTLIAQGHGITDAGCIPRFALEVLTEAGFCDDVDWPFDLDKVLKHPLPDAYTEAFDQRLITSFYKIYATGDDRVLQIKQALTKGHPVIYGSLIDQGYSDYMGGSYLQPPAGPYIGSHMRCLGGYTPEGAIEINSWGPGWGENGLGYIGWDFIKWESAFDFWVFDGVPSPTG